jgi:hypothetical protein
MDDTDDTEEVVRIGSPRRPRHGRDGLLTAYAGRCKTFTSGFTMAQAMLREMNESEDLELLRDQLRTREITGGE